MPQLHTSKFLYDQHIITDVNISHAVMKALFSLIIFSKVSSWYKIALPVKLFKQ